MKNRRVVFEGSRYPVHYEPPAVIAYRVVDIALSSGYVIAKGKTILNPNLSEFGLYHLIKIGPSSIAAYLPVCLI